MPELSIRDSLNCSFVCFVYIILSGHMHAQRHMGEHVPNLAWMNCKVIVYMMYLTCVV